MSYWPHSNPESPPGVATGTLDRCPWPGPPCPGGCNRAWRQAGGTRLQTQPIPGRPVWCSKCVSGIRHAVQHLVDGYAQLELDKLHGKGNGAGEHVSGSRNPPSPSPAADVQDEMVRQLTLWEDRIREALGLNRRTARLPVTRSRPLDRCAWPRPIAPRRQSRSVQLVRATQESATLAGTVRFLLAHLDWALAHPDAGLEFGRDILRLRAKVTARAATAPERRRRPVPCPRCELRTLVHVSGSEHVECENPDCGRLLTLDEYDAMAAAVARSESA